jgi:hypothetical protein
MPVQKYEYKTVEKVHNFVSGRIKDEKRMNDEARNGWRLRAVDTNYLYFERKVRSAKKRVRNVQV